MRSLSPLVALILAVLPRPGSAQTDLAQRVDRVYARGGFERTFVEDGPAVEAPRRADIGRSREMRKPAPIDIDPAPGWMSAIGRAVAVALPWIAAAILCAAILVAVMGRLRRPSKANPAASQQRGLPSGPAMEPGVEDWEALAAAGRFDDAVHAILGAAIARIAAQADVNPSRTSREIARSVSPGTAARDAFGAIVRAVETSRFGGRPAARGDYDACAAAIARIGGDA